MDRLEKLEGCYTLVSDSEDTGFKVIVVGNLGVKFEVVVSRCAIGQMLHTEIEFIKRN